MLDQKIQSRRVTSRTTEKHRRIRNPLSLMPATRPQVCHRFLTSFQHANQVQAGFSARLGRMVSLLEFISGILCCNSFNKLTTTRVVWQVCCCVIHEPMKSNPSLPHLFSFLQLCFSDRTQIDVCLHCGFCNTLRFGFSFRCCIGMSKDPAEGFRGKGRNVIQAMLRQKLFRAVFACLLKKNSASTRVVIQEVGDVMNTVGHDDPAVIRCTMPCNLFMRKLGNILRHETSNPDGMRL
mmetsp:Transcript_1264/g.2634  ORF Transcript_1264/g.2634 Transcript_1264/m.2634 type:complete len:237 (-) Transcript_1264:58-768(-)